MDHDLTLDQEAERIYAILKASADVDLTDAVGHPRALFESAAGQWDAFWATAA